MDPYATATRIALADVGTEKLRWLCWAVAGVKRLPFGWTFNPRLLAIGERWTSGVFEEARFAAPARTPRRLSP